MNFSDFQAKNLISKDFQKKKMQSNCYQEYEIILLKEPVIALLDYTKILPVNQREKYVKIF